MLRQCHRRVVAAERDQLAEVAQHLGSRIARADLSDPLVSAPAAGGDGGETTRGVGAHDGLRPPVETRPIRFGDPEIVGDHHRGQWFEQLADDVGGAVGHLIETCDDELADAGLDVDDLPGVKPRATSLRNRVWTGGSCMTSGGLSAMPIASSSP